MSPAAANPPTIYLVGPDEASDVDLHREPGTRGCDLCGTAIGVVVRDSPTGGDELGWIPFYEVMADGDDGPTRLDEQCLDWLKEIKAVL